MKKTYIMVYVVALLLILAACDAQSGLHQNPAEAESDSISSEDGGSLSSTENEERQSFENILAVEFSIDMPNTTIYRYEDLSGIAELLEFLNDMRPIEKREVTASPDTVAILICVQDGPGTSYTLRSYPGTLSSTQSEVTVVEGEITCFYADAEVYDALVGQVDEARTYINRPENEVFLAPLQEIVDKYRSGTVENNALEPRFAEWPQGVDFPVITSAEDFTVLPGNDMTPLFIDLRLNGNSGEYIMRVGVVSAYPPDSTEETEPEWWVTMVGFIPVESAAEKAN